MARQIKKILVLSTKTPALQRVNPYGYLFDYEIPYCIPCKHRIFYQVKIHTNDHKY